MRRHGFCAAHRTPLWTPLHFSGSIFSQRDNIAARFLFTVSHVFSTRCEHGFFDSKGVFIFAIDDFQYKRVPQAPLQFA
ncbi:hypothetical protein EDD55_11243 [Varunaivibrio sulfuroxidans]|uniref:Uncharacterized protein n=1 Tax=Varunaivibrio sulfuroxidans TaxID=1773489 RepID=A0A4R3J6R6_9PROT|nr:hypothetical protein EDD55_11243 [Varunaivibrio sulfuroxidans]